MSHTYTSLHYHVVFSTKDRAPLLGAEQRPRIYGYLGGIIRELKGETLAIGGVEDHVHVLCRLGTPISVGDALRQIKGGSSHWINDQLALGARFAWQTGYAAFTVSKSRVDDVRRYVEAQEEHHRRHDFKEELRALLQHHGIEYDERYLWD